LFEDAHKRKFDTVLFWCLERLSREGMMSTINYLQRLAGYGVGFHSRTVAKDLGIDRHTAAEYAGQ
jgi:DNA invertase Pin-like site-specific DNA recombinase